MEVQDAVRDSEARCRLVDEKRCEELDEHRKTMEAMAELLGTSDAKLEVLEAGAKQGTVSSARDSSRLRRRSGRIREAAADASAKSESAKRRLRGKRATCA
jgi:hypothetical protein